MNKEQTKEEDIKNTTERLKHASRRERREAQKQLRKKYNDNYIKISFGKSFTKKSGMTRAEARLLRKDTNLVKNLLAITKKYLPDLFKYFDNLSDKRIKGRSKYSMKTICVTRLFGLLCGLTSMTSISDNFNTETAIKNIAKICGQDIDELPYWQTIQDVFMDIDTEQLRDIQKYIVKAFLRSKMFDKYKYKGYFQLVFDGTGLTNHDYNLNNTCLYRKHKDGKTSYYKYVLECKLVVGNIVISVDSEFIENLDMSTESKKQDCETKAFERMIVRIKKNYPKQKFIVTGDALYANTTIIDLCKTHFKYIFNLKPNRLKDVNSQFEGNIKLQNEVNIDNYYLSTGIVFNKNIFNVFKYVEIVDDKQTTFRYISNLDVNNSNIREIVKLGRNRWKIENEAFYLQKHGTFNISHISSRNEKAMKNHYFFIQFAHVLRQLLEQGCLETKKLKLKIIEISSYILKSLISTLTLTNTIKINFQLRFDD